MKVLPVFFLNNEINVNRENLKIRKKGKNSINITNIKNMPDYRYMLNFGANNENLDSFFIAYSDGKGMPKRFENYLRGIPKEERIRKKDIYSVYKEFYRNIEESHSVEELKKFFPLEFSKIKSSREKDVNNKEGTFISKINEWADFLEENNFYLFPETKDNDLTVYLAKKIYFEAKTKDEIEKDFKKDLNPLLKQDDLENMKSRFGKGKDIIPKSIYEKLGLTGEQSSNGYRYSLSSSREEYIKKYGSIYTEKRRENFECILKEVVKNEKNEETKIKIPAKNTVNYEKLQYIMFYVWNNSIELRRAMSDFLIEKREKNNEMLTPDIMEINNDKEKNDYCKNLHNLMMEFWEKNPEYREYFSEKCKDAFSIVEFTIDNGTFEDLKSDIDKKRLEIYLMLKKEKEDKEIEIRKKEEIKLREENLARKKYYLSQEIKRGIMEIKNERAVPNSFYTEITRKSQEISKNLEYGDKNLDELTREVEKVLNYTDCRIKEALSKTSAEILEISNKYYENGNLTEFQKKLIEKYKKMYGFEKIDTGAANIMFNDMMRAVVVFETLILEKYIVFLNQFQKAEVPREKRKKKIKELIDSIKKHPKFENFFDKKEKSFIFDEMAKKLFEVPPQKLLSLYQKIFNTVVIDEKNIEDKYKYEIKVQR